MLTRDGELKYVHRTCRRKLRDDLVNLYNEEESEVSIDVVQFGCALWLHTATVIWCHFVKVLVHRTPLSLFSVISVFTSHCR